MKAEDFNMQAKIGLGDYTLKSELEEKRSELRNTTFGKNVPM